MDGPREGSTDKASLGAGLPDGEVDGLGLGAKVSDGDKHWVFGGIHLKPCAPTPFANLQHTSLPVQIGPPESPASAHVFLETVPGPKQLSTEFVHAYLPLPLFETQQYSGQLLLSWPSIQPLV